MTGAPPRATRTRTGFEVGRLGGPLSLGPSFSLDLEGNRREHVAAAPEHAIVLHASLRW